MKSPKLEAQRLKSRAGAALMLALWALFLLSAMIISWALDINSRLAISSSANRIVEAEAMACSGSEVALHPLIKPDSANLTRHLGDNESYEAHITGEGGRIDLNWVVAGENPDHIEIMRRYLENQGIDLDERNRMMDNLLDYTQPSTGIHHMDADPESDDYHLKHALLTRVDELKKVKGWQQFTSQPGWDDDFTVNGDSRGIDMAWASRNVMLALPGLTEPMVDAFLQLRRGPDGIDGTADDAQFRSLNDVGTALGLTAAQFQQLENLNIMTFQSPIFRIVSVGRSGPAKRTVQMVVRKVGNASAPQLVTWKEF